ncbi:AsnC-like helix-turn-helix protein [Hydrogenivirga caldilitoris]|uniref:AsnC-like helix-turn-helix protein n=2 Tax=Hydrogenivirga caldilitoris TaxID=246264 RepID=A0A497XPY1_9AQUI|nr:AsnC-like helix-turn-helix protein [Hydrogenivirga caldilitoris]
MSTEEKVYPMSITELMELEGENAIRAYILIKADPREIPSIMLALSTFEGVRTADVVTGPYDTIVFVEVPNQDELGRLVINKIHSLEGVREALTCVVVRI